MSKTALIVDDSRSARIVLKKMLEAHELGVDTAESAEDALVYLNDNRPDVIFMDHLMPGMDGFEAVSAIKNNPDTATIPIMMYTSQEGELYVGQARALGAVGVLPKQIEPVEVSKVLESLRVISSERGSEVASATEAAAEVSGEFPGLETLDHDLRFLIQDLFDQQRAVLRRDLLDSYEAIATRVADEIRPPDEAIEVEPEVDEFGGSSRLMRGAAIALVLASLVFAWLYWQREQSWTNLQAQFTALQQQIADQQAADVSNTIQSTQQINEYQESLGAMFAATLESIEWGANQNSMYQFNELPLGDARLAILEQLSDRLLAINFSGVVRIESHVGNFCVVAFGPDGYQLAPAETEAVNCELIGVSAGEAYEMGLRQSIAFANFIRLADVQTEGSIRYEIVSLGNADPLMAYPTTPAGVTAGVWNEIASNNNRVELSIVPD